MSLYENEEVRAAAVQAAAQALGREAWNTVDTDSGYRVIPSPAFQQFTERVEAYIARGRWGVDG
jgi:hypothetical protein